MPSNRQNQRRAVRTSGFASRFEQEIAAALKSVGVSFDYEARSFPWKEKVPNAYCGSCEGKVCYADRSYTPDFFIYRGSVLLYIIEAKGIFTPKDRKIADAMREQHPDVTFRYLFYRDNKLTRSSKTRYSKWCEKRDLDYALRHNMKEALALWQNDDYGES